MTDELFQLKVFLNNKALSQDQLNRFSEITVEQEVDMAWEAHLRVPIFADEKGKWTGQDEDLMKPFSRIRIEIKAGENDFSPLIDGPIIGADTSMNSEPGQSFTTIVVQDDSYYLNQIDDFQQFENVTEYDIVKRLFSQASQITSTDIDSASSSLNIPILVQRGTPIQLLKSLAKRHGMHAYVLPGETPGQSIGCFKPFPTQPSGLAALVLMGEARNMSYFNITSNASKPSRFSVADINIADKTELSEKATFRDSSLLGDEPSFEAQGNDTLQALRNDLNLTVDIEQFVNAQAADSGYSFEANGTVEDRYTDVLQPYKVITAMAVNARNSGDYVISKVTHKLTETFYSQSFSLRRNARSIGSGSKINGSISGGIF